LLLAVSVGAANRQDRAAGLPAVARAAEIYPPITAQFGDSADAAGGAERSEHDHGIRVEVVRHPANRTVGRWVDAGQPDLFDIHEHADGFVPLPKR
jgi:putative transposase